MDFHSNTLVSVLIIGLLMAVVVCTLIALLNHFSPSMKLWYRKWTIRSILKKFPRLLSVPLIDDLGRVVQIIECLPLEVTQVGYRFTFESGNYQLEFVPSDQGQGGTCTFYRSTGSTWTPSLAVRQDDCGDHAWILVSPTEYVNTIITALMRTAQEWAEK